MHPIHSRLDSSHRKTYAAFASGDGVKSLLSVANAVLEGEPASRLMLFYGHRDAAHVTQLEEFQALKDRYLPRLALYFFFSDEPQDVELFNGQLDGAKVQALAGVLFVAAEVNDFFLCGPEEMNHSIAEALQGLGVDGAKVHGEKSTVQENKAVAAERKQDIAANVTAVTVLMDGRRRNFSMARGDSSETVLEAGEKAGLELPFSCRAGVCSTCRTKVTKGAVEMAQNYALEPWEVEEGYVLACQSHPTTAELELDYDDK